MKNGKATLGFHIYKFYIINMANFEAFCRIISSSRNVLFLKSERDFPNFFPDFSLFLLIKKYLQNDKNIWKLELHKIRIISFEVSEVWFFSWLCNGYSQFGYYIGEKQNIQLEYSKILDL